MRKFGWKRGARDKRDRSYKIPRGRPKLPKSFSNADLVATVYDQGSEGSCTANAICAALDATRAKNGLAPMHPARDFLYALELIAEGHFGIDFGASVRTGFKCAAKQGVCRESTHPYTGRGYQTKPKQAAYAEALDYQLDAYQAVKQDLYSLQYCLTQRQTVVIGFEVYESFQSGRVAKTGLMPIPNTQREAHLGGHSVLAVGFEPGYFVCLNSWGTRWGQQGFFKMPAALLTNPSLAGDFWTPIHTEAGPS